MLDTYHPRFALPAVCLAVVLVGVEATLAAAAAPRKGQATVLGINGTQFTLDGKPGFLLGISYYGELGTPEDFIRRDLDDLQDHGFNWLRVWATWAAFDHDVSAVDANGQQREPFLSKLQWLVAECDRRGLVVDVTLTRNAERLADLESHQRAVKVIVQALKPHRNWYLDLANERNVHNDRYVSASELKRLRELVRRLDRQRLVTASFGGHDLSEEDMRESLLTIGLDFLSPHRPRNAASASQTEERTRACFGLMKKLGRSVPVHYREPFRRGYGRWEPATGDFLTDLRESLAGGAAGWCFHNGGRAPRRTTSLGGRSTCVSSVCSTSSTKRNGRSSRLSHRNCVDT